MPAYAAEGAVFVAAIQVGGAPTSGRVGCGAEGAATGAQACGADGAGHRLPPEPLGMAGHGDGESCCAESAAVTAKLQASLHYFELSVGTEEEFHIAGGTTDSIGALRAVRAVIPAVLVCKRGRCLHWGHPRQP